MPILTDWRPLTPEDAVFITPNADRVAWLGTKRVRILCRTTTAVRFGATYEVCLDLGFDTPAGMPAADECDTILCRIFPEYVIR
jgi:hypothetical protein